VKSPVPETRNSLILRLPDKRDVEAWDQFVTIYEPLVYRLARAKGHLSASQSSRFLRLLLDLARLGR